MRIIKPLSICLAVLSAGTLLGGCTLPGNRTVYKYDDPKIVDDFVLTKSVYEEDRLTLFLNSPLSDKCKVRSDVDIDYEIKNGRIEITADDVSEITSLTIHNDQHKYELRYLNTDQYAVLAYTNVVDIGWMHDGGEIEDYYTQDELDEQRRRKEEQQAIFDANWTVVKGYYEADSGNSIKFYGDTYDRFLREGKHSYSVKYVWIDSDGKVSVECDGGYMQYFFYCVIAEDGTYIVARDYDLGEDVKYYRKS